MGFGKWAIGQHLQRLLIEHNILRNEQPKCEVESHENQEADVHREVYEQGKIPNLLLHYTWMLVTQFETLYITQKRVYEDRLQDLLDHFTSAAKRESQNRTSRYTSFKSTSCSRSGQRRRGEKDDGYS